MSSEHQIQRALIKWRDARVKSEPRLRNLFAIPNGGARDAVTGARLKAEGVRAGVPDLFLAWHIERYHMVGKEIIHGLFIELKTPRGRLSQPQKECIEDLEDAGYTVAVCRSTQEAIDVIEEYLR